MAPDNETPEPAPAADPVAEAARQAFRTSFGAVLRIDIADDAPLYIDGRADPPVIGRASLDVEPACVWRTDKAAIGRMLNGKRAFENAYLSGRVAIAGDFGVMARLELEASK